MIACNNNRLLNFQTGKTGKFCQQSKIIEGLVNITFDESISEEMRKKNLFKSKFCFILYRTDIAKVRGHFVKNILQVFWVQFDYFNHFKNLQIW